MKELEGSQPEWQRVRPPCLFDPIEPLEVPEVPGKAGIPHLELLVGDAAEIVFQVFRVFFLRENWRSRGSKVKFKKVNRFKVGKSWLPELDSNQQPSGSGLGV